MNAGVASRTALGVARERAAHQALDQPVIFYDPLALRIAACPGNASRGSRALRAFVAARSRYAEDQVSAFFAQGVRQYVVLGAGLDTFAYRNPYAPALRVFEVDYPDTQAWKMERLKLAGIEIPHSVSFVPVNFEEQELSKQLACSPAFDPSGRAIFSLLGVTPYLTKSAFLETLRVIASMPEGSGVVLDYGIPAACLTLTDRVRRQALAARVAMAGESFRLFLLPREISGILHDLGFTRIEDLGPEEINLRYFANRRDGLRIGGASARLLSATVGPS